MFADLHVHPGLKPFHSGHPLPDANKNIYADLDNPGVKDFLRWLANVAHMGVIFYSQSNLERMRFGKVRVACVSLYPLEKGFAKVDLQEAPFLQREILRLFGYDDIHLVEAVAGVQKDKVAFIRNTEDDYFPFLEQEYQYMLAQTKTPEANTKAKFVRDFTELKTVLAEPDTIALINTIEGAHVFGAYSQDDSVITPERLKTYSERIAHVKNVWEFPPFFISLQHHFWNHLGGHARSLSGLLSDVVNQNDHMNEGLNELGKHVIRELLSNQNGKRILVDIKHMSARSRKDFYGMLKTEFSGEKIPIICSHTGIMDQRETLNRIIAEPQDTEEANANNYLHNWSINLCKEDILNIYRSGGLIGIQLDEKRLGGGLAQTKLTLAKKKQPQPSNDPERPWLVREEYMKLLWGNIFTLVRYIRQPDAWDIITIGSDMDGLINPMDIYPDSTYMDELAEDMRDFLLSKTPIPELNLRPEFIKNYMYGYTPEELVNKIMFSNMEDFLEKNFQDHLA
ncbi:MAG TPA: membrane dipeptidase [Bacteroidia bacterium]|nr:membrane dipeptidase [Bacteroidia bacterium]HNP97442.1 membrane dipeptidase [Bacteroidia bacterium]